MRKITAGFVALPDTLKVAITSVVTWGVSMVLTNLVLLVPFLQFLEQFKQPLSLALAAALIGVIEKAIPDAFAKVAVIAIELLLAILAMFGVGATLAAQGVLPALLR